jgi:hypothetical protein
MMPAPSTITSKLSGPLTPAASDAASAVMAPTIAAAAPDNSEQVSALLKGVASNSGLVPTECSEF